MRKRSLAYGLLTVALLTSCTAGSWAFEIMPSSARALGVGGAGAALSGGFGEVLAQNPALLTASDVGASLFYNNRFAISGFEEQSISFAWRTGKLHWGVLLLNEAASLAEENQGSTRENQWQELELGLGLAVQVRKNTNLGLGLWSQRRTISVDDDPEGLFADENTIFASLGLYYDRQKLGFSAVLEDPTGLSQGKLGLRLGELGRLVALAEVKYEFVEERVNYYAGVETWLAPNFALRAGVDLAGMFTAGLGLGKGNWKVDYAYKTHPAGNAHYLGTSYGF
mgnify:FL=1